MTYRYLIVIEKTDTGFSAYSPDVPGCIATAKTSDDVTKVMNEAIEFHLEGMSESGLEIPKPQAIHSFAVVNLPAHQEREQHVAYHIVPRNGVWVVKRSNAQRASSIYTTKNEAVRRAKHLARSGRVVVHNRDGSTRDL